jgi:hypothetical protein
MTIFDPGQGDGPGRDPDTTSRLIWLVLGILWIGIVLLCIATRGVTR